MADSAALAEFVGRFTQMRALAARAERESPSDPRAMFGAARAYLLTGAYEPALAAVRRACALDPHNTHFLFERGSIEEYLGLAAAAVSSYAAALRAEPLNYKAAYALTSVRRQSPADNTIAELKAAFGAPDQDGWRTLHLGHALAKCYEDLGDLEASVDWLARAKARRREIRPYAAAAEEALANAVIGAPAAVTRTAGFESNEPIFVLGLPRSGTTLIERILASHPDVSAAGELSNFALLHKLMTGSAITMDAAALARSVDLDFRALGEAYIGSTRPLTGVRPRFVDKAPSNYLLADRILNALPNVRIICMRRHPLDSVLSNYKQIFPIDDRFFDYVYGLESAAHKFVQFDSVLAHWRVRLPPERFMLLQYEDLVVSQEMETRRLLAFCGLSWNARCLAFHETKAGVATPSAAQVRQPLYASAAGRWARYGALLDPARRVLEAAGVAL